jgi:hypothetical protein
MDTLKIIFVVVLCMPILYFGVTLAMRLLDNAIANKQNIAKTVVRRRRGNR